MAKELCNRLWFECLLVSLMMVTVSAMASALTIGDDYGGGKIAWIDSTGRHGMIAAKADLPDLYSWLTAKKACRDLHTNGYRDWYLPGKDELNKLYHAKRVVGGFADDYYWSSTLISVVDGWIEYLGDGKQELCPKCYLWRVRPVRAF
jgi:hypothetical protein